MNNDDKLSAILTSRVTLKEREKIETKAEIAELTISEYIRRCLLDLPLPSIISVPEINRKKWCELAHITKDLNQIARAINAGKSSEFIQMRKCITELSEHIYKLRQEILGH